jgi:[acyl-carrier-protein] S-malonyltransferase
LSKTAFLFPGQGAQSIGMGRRLAEEYSAARQLFDRARDVLGYDLAKICWEGPDDRLNATDVCQPAIFVVSLAAVEASRQAGSTLMDECEAAAGLSLGEYTALVVAGVLDFESALQVVQQRGEAMQAASTAVPSGMTSILGLDGSAIETLCDKACQPGEVLQIANYLCPGNIVVSGSRGACERIAALAESAGAMKVIPLSVAGAFHTSIMEPAVSRLAAALEQVEWKPARVPIISNVDAEPHTEPDELRGLLLRQIVSPVRWEDSIRRLLADGCDAFCEIGPGRVLRGLLRRIDRKAKCENIGD